MLTRAAGGFTPPAVSRPLLGAALLTVLALAAGCGEGSPSTADAPAPIASTESSASSVSATSSGPATTATVVSEAPVPSSADVDADVPFDVQGHRGARGLRPESTLPGFEVALDLGVDTLELDLHFTGDGQVVVWHDPTISADKCVSNGNGGAALGSPIADLTRDELAGFRCAENPDPERFPDQEAEPTPIAGDDYSIVTLGELFDFVAGYAESDLKSPDQRTNAETVRFNIETKRRPEQPDTIGDGFDGETPGPFELAILDVIAARGIADRVTIQSFDHRSLRAIRAVDESIQLAALTRRNVAFAPEFAEFAEIWSPDHRSLSASGLNDAHVAGMLVVPWTVNDPSDMLRLIDLGVDGLISDRPDLVVRELATGS